jgi:hypothetical protein
MWLDLSEKHGAPVSTCQRWTSHETQPARNIIDDLGYKYRAVQNELQSHFAAHPPDDPPVLTGSQIPKSWIKGPLRDALVAASAKTVCADVELEFRLGQKDKHFKPGVTEEEMRHLLTFLHRLELSQTCKSQPWEEIHDVYYSVQDTPIRTRVRPFLGTKTLPIQHSTKAVLEQVNLHTAHDSLPSVRASLAVETPVTALNYLPEMVLPSHYRIKHRITYMFDLPECSVIVECSLVWSGESQMDASWQQRMYMASYSDAERNVMSDNAMYRNFFEMETIRAKNAVMREVEIEFHAKPDQTLDADGRNA